MIKKFTVIYTEAWTSGNHRRSIVKFTRITLKKGESVNAACEREKIELGAIDFIFVGHPEMEGED